MILARLPVFLALLLAGPAAAVDWSLTAAAAPVERVGNASPLQFLPKPLHLGERLRTGAGGRLRVTGPQGLVLTLGEVAELGLDADRGAARLILDGGLLQIDSASASRLAVVLGGHTQVLDLGERSRVWLERSASGTSTCLLQGALLVTTASTAPLLPGECDYRSPQGRSLRVMPSPEALRLRQQQLALPEPP